MRNCYVIYEHRAIADLVEGFEMGLRANVRLITRINVPKESRGQGVGRQLLKMIMDDADKDGITLVLEILPSGGLDYDQLDAWYRRAGFSIGSLGLYVRRPKQN